MLDGKKYLRKFNQGIMLFSLSYVYLLLNVILCMGGETSKARPFPKTAGEAKGRYKEGVKDWFAPPDYVDKDIVIEKRESYVVVQQCKCPPKSGGCKCSGNS